MTGSPLCLPTLLAAFSHKDVFHLAINMFVLFSFAQTGVAVLGQEQFLAMYTSAAVFASLASLAHKVLSRSTIPSVGASGAILAVFAMHCLFFPDSRIEVIFLPFLGLSACYALPTVAAIDSLGVLLRWRWLDHAAHLGGSCFGRSVGDGDTLSLMLPLQSLFLWRTETLSTVRIGRRALLAQPDF